MRQCVDICRSRTKWYEYEYEIRRNGNNFSKILPLFDSVADMIAQF